DLNSEQARGEWKQVKGDLPSVFTTSRRQAFDPPQPHFVSTAELPGGKFSDAETCVIESPSVKIDSPWLFAYLSGAADPKNLYVAFVDAENGEELTRVSPTAESNTFVPRLINASAWQGRTIFVRIVDNSEAEWGHINFGGLHRGDVKE